MNILKTQKLFCDEFLTKFLSVGKRYLRLEKKIYCGVILVAKVPYAIVAALVTPSWIG